MRWLRRRRREQPWDGFPGEMAMSMYPPGKPDPGPDLEDLRATLVLWFERHRYPADPTWQAENVICDLRGAGLLLPEAEPHEHQWSPLGMYAAGARRCLIPGCSARPTTAETAEQH